MATVIPGNVSEKVILADEIEIGPNDEDGVTGAIPPLGKPKEHKRLWFQKSKQYNPNDIATQV